MMDKAKRLLAMLLAAILLLSACMSAAMAEPGTKPVVQSHPKDATVKQGGKVSFGVAHTGATGITWRLYNPDTDETVLASQAASTFKGLKVSGPNSTTLRLSNVPGELDGWEVYCTLSNPAGKTHTRHALLTVTDRNGKPLTTAAPNEEAGEAGESPAFDGQVTVRAIGAYLQAVNERGKVEGKAADMMTFDGAAAFKVTAEKKSNISYWVINGVRYDFNKVVKSIVISELTEDMIIEVVYKGKASQTLPKAQEIQAARAGDAPMVVRSIHAKMSHVKANGKNAGGTFTEFDFSNDYRNKATGKTVPGGLFTGRVTATVPTGKRVSYWKFEDTKLDFDSNVTNFVVNDLYEGMTYEPVFVKLSDVKFNVTCNRCVFSGGGYSGASSGQVSGGTVITVQGVPFSMWGSFTVNGSPYGGEGGSITLTITSDTTINYSFVVN